MNLITVSQKFYTINLTKLQSNLRHPYQETDHVCSTTPGTHILHAVVTYLVAAEVELLRPPVCDVTA